MRKLVLSVMMCLLIIPTSGYGQTGTVAVPDEATVLNTLRKGHPRLMLTDEGLERLKDLSLRDTVLKRYMSDVVSAADGFLNAPRLKHQLIGPRLLSVSRACLERVMTLGLAWRLTGDERYAEAVEDNLLTVAGFPDWNPSHFLDTAEMSNAVGIGYDWLYDWLSTASRDSIRNGLIRLGMEEGVKCYNSSTWWRESTHNWNQVCNGGLMVGALAIAETDPHFAQVIVTGAVKSLPLALNTYAPDGAWPEGPGYWHYASRYTAYGLSALETALGTDFGLSDMAGLDKTGQFPIYTTGPTGLYLNFADSGERAARGPMAALFWLARRFDDPFVASSEHNVLKHGKATAQHLVWYVPPQTGIVPEPSLDRLFRGSVEVAVMRSAWNDPRALFVGVKAGYNQVNHGHLDLGTFELDALGVRWARDLGADDYNLPDYWGRDPKATRWTYYRLSSFSHSVPLIGGRQQDVYADAVVEDFRSNLSEAHVIIDLSTAYIDGASSVRRGVKMLGGRRAVLVQDEFTLTAPAIISWAMTTDTNITLNGDSATLMLNGKILDARIITPADAVFSVESAERKPPEKRNTGVRRLLVRVDAAGDERIAVLLSPRWPDGTVETSALVTPLSRW